MLCEFGLGNGFEQCDLSFEVSGFLLLQSCGHKEDHPKYAHNSPFAGLESIKSPCIMLIGRMHIALFRLIFLKMNVRL